MKKLADKVAIITGASKGLGKAMALALAEAGARLALVSRNLQQLNQTAAAVRELGAQATVFQADVTDEAQVLGLQKAVARDLGKLQILNLYLPEKGKKTHMIEGSPAEAAKELVRRLRDEARVIGVVDPDDRIAG